MMAQPYVDGITDTVPHRIASSLAASQIPADEDTISVRWSRLIAGSLATSRWSPAVTAARSPAR